MKLRAFLPLSLVTAGLIFSHDWTMPSDGPIQTASAADPDPEELPSRVYADAFLVWIYKTPKLDRAPIGTIRGGQSVALRKVEGVPLGRRTKKGCGKGWFAVEPQGYVCLDRRASLSPTRYTRSMAELQPRPGAYLFDYALSMGSPSYRRTPTLEEWTRKERPFGVARPRPLPPHWRGHEELITDSLLPLSLAPSFLEGDASVSRNPENRLVRREVPFGSMLAINSSFEDKTRRYLQSADGTIVPADRFRLFKPSTFEGVELPEEARVGPTPALHLPVAWPRKKTRQYSIVAAEACAIDGSGSQTNATAISQGRPGTIATKPAQLPRTCLTALDLWGQPRSVLQLSGRTVDVAGTRFVETNEKTWLPLRYLYLAEAKPAPPSLTVQADQRWIHFRIGQGTLVTYQGDTPVFATLASPGIGGVPAPGADPLATRTTPVGTFRIQFKHVSDDMSPEQTEHREFWIADVPYAMYFQQPFAIHVAYWHESFGEPMSGGCVNVSPKDGKRLFDFTSPVLPADWYGVGASKEMGFGTTVVIDR
jgi:lipoprotein-anchoring transpeptidase ErfK/SrfK